MVKIIGVAILSISSIVVGLLLYEKYKIRPASLLMLINLLNNYHLELKLKRKSFYDVLYSCKTEDGYLKECKSLLMTNKTIEQAMITKNTFFENLELSNEDKVIMLNFVKRTGQGSFKDELILCDDTVSALKTQLTESNNKLKKSGAFSLKIAVAVALWIAIILL